MKRNKFSLSHNNLLTCEMGKLYPITWYEALPGDTIQHAVSMLLRVSPLLAPVMHPVRVRIHNWFVPYRLIWEDWEDFITGGSDGTATPVHPYFSFGSCTEGSIHDYMGVPVASSYSPNLTFSALPVRAYTLIFNEHYRDQDLVDEETIDLTSGQDTTTSPGVLSVSWEKDYFTTSRPWETKGDSVTIPLLGDAPVTGIGAYDQTWTTGPASAYETDGSGTESYAKYKLIGPTANHNIFMEEDPDNSGYPNVRADLAAASGVSINELRLALAIQRYQEARAQYGSRYVEYLRYLGVRSSDARLQNPEYLSGARQVIQFSEVLQHAEGGSDYVGTMRGHGIAAVRSPRYRRFFEEHGIVMSLLSVVPKTIYANGLHKSFSREVKEDYFQKELQFIGDQEVLNQEVYAEHTNRDEVFGYQRRYDEYRSLPSRIAGEFNSTLDHWHMARIFGSDPSLNSTFVNCAPTDRIYASTETDPLLIMANHSIQARRMITKYGQAKTF